MLSAIDFDNLGLVRRSTEPTTRAPFARSEFDVPAASMVLEPLAPESSPAPSALPKAS